MSESKSSGRKISNKPVQEKTVKLDPDLELYKILEPMNLPPLLRTQAK